MVDRAVRFSEVDSTRFGARIFRANVLLATDVAPILADCRGDGAEMLIVRCPSDRIGVVQELQRAGASLMDTLVYFRASVPESPGATLPPGIDVRPFQASDLPALTDVTREAFNHYFGHYHADSRLNPQLATEGYVEWCMGLTSLADTTMKVVTDRREVLGYLATRRADQDRSAEIVLNAVAPRAQGRGLYGWLVKDALADCARYTEREIRASTQLQNVAPQKVWVRNGFEPQEAYYTFHFWFV
jgi:ribosomal protein S18 acetylase RimI-like enzyme